MSKKSSLIALYEAESNLIDINHEELDKINKIVTAPTKKPPPDSFKQELKQLSDMKRTFGKKTYPNDTTVIFIRNNICHILDKLI